MLFRFWVFPDCTFLDISTASVATLANFGFRESLVPKHKIAFWDTPKPLYRKDGATLWQSANAPSSCAAR